MKRLLTRRPFGSLEPACDFCGGHFGFGQRLEVANIFLAPEAALEMFLSACSFRPICRPSVPRVRSELIPGEIFYRLKEAKVVIGQWRHSALQYRPPAPQTLAPPISHVDQIEHRPCSKR